MTKQKKIKIHDLIKDNDKYLLTEIFETEKISPTECIGKKGS